MEIDAPESATPPEVTPPESSTPPQTDTPNQPQTNDLALPEESDAEGWNALYSKLGRPESADAYEIPLPEGDDGGFAKTAANWLFDAGLSQKQATAIATSWNEFQAEQIANHEKQVEQQREEHFETLQKEWGNKFEENQALVRRALTEFAPPSFVEFLERSGMDNHPEFTKMFLKIGKAIAGASTVKGESSNTNKSAAEVLYGSN